MAHHTTPDGNTYVDSDFVNDAQRVPGAELRHLGFGEFVFSTPKGEVEVDRMRGVDFEGQKGRAHKLYDDRHGSGAAEWLVSEVEKHGLSKRVAAMGVKFPIWKQMDMEENFKHFAPSRGLSPSDLGRTFQWVQGTLRIIGMNPNAHVSPIICENVRSGRIQNLAASDVKKRLEVEDRLAVENNLRTATIRLAHMREDLRPHLLSVLVASRDEWVVSPESIIRRALMNDLLSPEEARSKDVQYAAEAVAIRLRDEWHEGEGFGSSDMTFAIRDMLSEAGLSSDFVHGRLTRTAGTTLPGIPAVVTKVRGRMAFVVPTDPGSAPPEIAKGDWFRVLLPQVGEEGKLIPPTPGARHQDWLFAPYRMNEDYRGEPRQASAHTYVLSFAGGDRMPTVDGFPDPILFRMVLSKITGETVSPQMRVRDALAQALMAHPDAFEKFGHDEYRVRVAVGSIYEKGMRAASEGLAGQIRDLARHFLDDPYVRYHKGTLSFSEKGARPWQGSEFNSIPALLRSPRGKEMSGDMRDFLESVHKVLTPLRGDSVEVPSNIAVAWLTPSGDSDASSFNLDTEYQIDTHYDRRGFYGASSYSGDPKWLDAKYPGTAKDGTPFKRGDRILYWPRTKTVMVGDKAEAAWKQFQSEVQDEDFYNSGRYASAEKSGALKRYIVPAIAFTNELHERYTGTPTGTRKKVWIKADPTERRLYLEIEDTYDGFLDKFMEHEIPEDIGISNEKEVRGAIEKWVTSPWWKARGPQGDHTWDYTSRLAHAKRAAAEPDARVWYVGGGSWASNVNGTDLRGLREAFPKSTRRVSRNPNKDDSYSIYTTEKGADLIRAWLQEHGRSVGGNPQWDLAPGEMPSW